MFSSALRLQSTGATLRSNLDGTAGRRADTWSPEGSHVFFNGEPRMSSDKLLIDIFGLIVSADGISAIAAAVIIVFVLARRQPR